MGERESKNTIIPFVSALPAITNHPKRITPFGIIKCVCVRLLLIEMLFGGALKGCSLQLQTQSHFTEWNYREFVQGKRKLRRVPKYIIGQMLLSPCSTHKKIDHEYIVATDSGAREFFKNPSSRMICDNLYYGGYTMCYYPYNPYLLYIYTYEDTLYNYAENLSGETEKK